MADRSKPIVRLALDSDGPAIGALFAAAAHDDYGVDWTRARVGGWWLVAEAEDGSLAGAILASASQPFGYIGEVIVHPTWQAADEHGHGHFTGRLGRVAQDLLLSAFIGLRAAGSQLVFGAISRESFADLAVQHGMENLGPFTLVGRRL